MHNSLFRNAIGAIGAGALLLFAIVRFLEGKDDAGELLAPPHSQSERATEGATEPSAPAPHAGQEADSEVWYYDEPEMTDFHEPEPLLDTAPFTTTPAPQLDEALVAEDGGGWGGDPLDY